MLNLIMPLHLTGFRPPSIFGKQPLSEKSKQLWWGGGGQQLGYSTVHVYMIGVCMRVGALCKDITSEKMKNLGYSTVHVYMLGVCMRVGALCKDITS